MRYAEVGVVGAVVEGTGAELVSNGEVHDFTPRFRESAYTPIKKLAGEKAPVDYARMRGCYRPGCTGGCGEEGAGGCKGDGGVVNGD